MTVPGVAASDTEDGPVCDASALYQHNLLARPATQDSRPATQDSRPATKEPHGKVVPKSAVLLKSTGAKTGERLHGPAAARVLKLALHRVEDLPEPAPPTKVVDEASLKKAIFITFHRFMQATNAEWLIDKEEVREMMNRFMSVAWTRSTPVLKSNTSQVILLPPKWWRDMKKVFARALFEDSKVQSKPSFNRTPARLKKGPNTWTRTIQAWRRPRIQTRPFEVVLGPCTINAAGCFQSPNFPGNYSQRETCIISVNRTLTGILRVSSFATEPINDVLMVNGVRYSGTEGPDGVAPREDIAWFSDYTVGAAGFLICSAPPGNAAEDAAVAGPGARGPTVLSVASGDCTVDSRGCAMTPGYPSDYPVDSSCTLDVSAGSSMPLHVEEFATELNFDFLTVNGEAYSGSSGPEGIVPSGQITWSADYSVSQSGWKLCPANMTRYTELDNTTIFAIRSGECLIDRSGCVVSPGYPNAYGNSEICIVRVDADNAGPLHVEHFNTELGYDVLVVNGIRYSGRRSPEGVTPFTDILWYSDPTTSKTGWRLCSAPRIPLPAQAEDLSRELHVVEGPCTADRDGCAMSPNYPEPYGNSQACIINVSLGTTLPLMVRDFSTESQIDFLTVNGEAFSGIHGPDGVVPRGQIFWRSDEDMGTVGWRICLVEPPPDLLDHMTRTTTTTAPAGAATSATSATTATSAATTATTTTTTTDTTTDTTTTATTNTYTTTTTTETSTTTTTETMTTTVTSTTSVSAATTQPTAGTEAVSTTIEQQTTAAASTSAASSTTEGGSDSATTTEPPKETTKPNGDAGKPSTSGAPQSAALVNEWQKLSYHQNISTLLSQTLANIESATDVLFANAANFSQSARAVPLTLPADVPELDWLASWVRGGLLEALTPFENVRLAIRGGFWNIAKALPLNGQPTVLSRWLVDAMDLPQKFVQNTLYFGEEVAGQIEAMGRQPVDVLALSLEAIKVPFKQFTAVLDNFIQLIFAKFNFLVRFLKDQASMTFASMGPGTCLDADGSRFSVYTSTSLAITTHECMSACRTFADSQCHGFAVTFTEKEAYKADGRGKCELQMEQGYATPVNRSIAWYAVEPPGDGKGEVASSTGASPPGSVTECFKRQAICMERGTTLMREVILQEQWKLEAAYSEGELAWANIAFKLKSSFWRVASGASRALAAAAEAEGRLPAA